MLQKKTFRSRPLFFVCIALLLGVVFAQQILNLSPLAYVLVGVVFCLWVVFGAKNKGWILALICLASFFCGTGLFAIKTSLLNSKASAIDQQFCGQVSGFVSEQISHTTNYYSYLVTNVELDGKSADGNFLLGLICQDDSSPILAGCKISFLCDNKNNTLTKTKFVDYSGVNSYYAKYDVAFSAKCFSNTINVLSYEPTLAQKFRQSALSALKDGMDEDCANVAYAALFGDKSQISQQHKQNFSKLGTGHLLAVSGLHVGFLGMLLCFVLKLCRVRGYLRFFVMFALLGFYCYLCGFAVSVVRASVMLLIVMLSRATKRMPDVLTSLSLAMIITLLVNPLYAFDGGYLLSFSCVFSLILLSPVFSNLLAKIKIFGPINTSLSACLAIGIGTVPIMANTFSEITILNLVFNFVSIPIFQVAFTLMFAALPLAFISPAVASVVLFFPNEAMSLLLLATNFLTQFSFSLKLSSWNGASIALYYCLLFCISKFFMANRLVKTKLCLSFLVLLLCSSFAVSTNRQLSRASFCVLQVGDEFVYFFNDINAKTGVVYFGDNYAANKNEIEKYLKYSKLENVDYFIFFNESITKDINNVDYAKNIVNIKDKDNPFVCATTATECAIVVEMMDSKIMFASCDGGYLQLSNLANKTGEDVDFCVCKNTVFSKQFEVEATSKESGAAFKAFGNKLKFVRSYK